jgi:uncharacterized membrane protein YbhN (UPF0104 family)
VSTGGGRAWWARYRGPVLLGGLAIGLLLGVRASLGRLDAIGPDELPSRGAMAAAWVLLLLGQALVGYGWRRLVPGHGDAVASMWTFHASQPGKYLPLGVGQGVGQVSLARDLGLGGRAAVAAWASHLAMIVAAGVVVGVCVVVLPGTGAIRWAGLGCLVGLVAVHRPTLRRIVGAGGRFTERLPRPDDLPDQRGLLEAFAAGVGFVVLHGLAFAILLQGGDRGVAGYVGTIGAYALAVGLSTATPLPAGLGAREVLLVLVLPTDPAATLAAAILVRVCTFSVEVALLAAFWLLGRRRGS